MAVRWTAPGRVNLIGEHTDYNDGFVLPCAIAQGCTATVTARRDGVIEVRSAQQPEPVRAEVDELRPGASAADAQWADYVLGVVWALRGDGVEVPGLDIAVDSDVPAGAGLSSSAALVCSVATAVDDLLGTGLDPDAMLALTRAVENDFVGAPTGGMDQLASLRSRAGHALLCDMRTLHTDAVPLPLEAQRVDLLVVDTHAPHRHSDGEYRRRREGCEAAAAALGVPALRDVTVDELEAAMARLTEDETDGPDGSEAARYTRHVVTENDRVLRAAAALRAGDIAEVGRLFSASHASMRDDFRITVPEVDVVAETLERSGALGARMTGGGFGGCVIALVPSADTPAVIEAVRAASASRGFGAPSAFVAQPSAGAHPTAQ